MGDPHELITEAENELGLSQADAARMLFVVLAKHQGWTNAKISRYLGVSRARIGQKVKRSEVYLREHKFKKLKGALRGRPAQMGEQVDVTLPLEAWQDEEFVIGVLGLVMPEKRGLQKAA